METVYELPMFSRLQPKTVWSGGRISDTDLLTLADAASLASKHAGTEITVSDFTRAAGRGEILLRAIVHKAAVMNPSRPADKPLNIPAGSIPTLPLTACRSISITGQAVWRHIDGHERAEAFDNTLCRYTRWLLNEADQAFETSIEDCRITGYDVHALADAFGATSEQSIQCDSKKTVALDMDLCALAEQVNNGGPLDWEYWAARTKIAPSEAAKLVYCIDPLLWPNDDYAQGSIDKLLQHKIAKCAALLGDLRSEWGLQSLVDYLGPGGAPARMQEVVLAVSAHQASQVVARAHVSTEKLAWVTEARALGEDYIQKWRAAGCAPTVDDAALYVEGVFSSDRRWNTRDEMMKRGTIKREALAGISGRKAGEHVKTKKVPKKAAHKLPDC